VPMMTTDTLSQIASMVEQQAGLVFRGRTLSRLADAVSERMSVIGSQDIAYYQHLLLANTTEMKELISLLTIGETRFFRHMPQFEALKNHIIRICNSVNRQNLQSIHLWSACCSTGEEAYSMAILLEEMAPVLDGIPATVLATDIDAKALAKAKQGVYSKKSLYKIPLGYRGYFKETEDSYEVKDHIRSKVVFRPFNLVSDPDYLISQRFEVIFCRNVFIYFNKDTVNKVVDRICSVLEPGGMFVPSPAELAMVANPDLILHPVEGGFFTKRRPIPHFYSQDTLYNYSAANHFDCSEVDSLRSQLEFLKKAKIAADLGDYTQVIDICSKLLALDSPRPEAYFMMALALIETDKPDDALTYLEKAINIEPQFALAHFWKAGLLCRAGRLEEGVEAYQKSVDSINEGGFAGLLPVIMDSIDMDEIKHMAEEYIKLFGMSTVPAKCAN